MAGIDKIVIPQLGAENWSVWKAKFQALLEYKGLFVAIEQPDSEDGKKASSQAKALMTLHTQDAYVKLFQGQPTAAGAWKKLEENFEKKSNARVIQLRKKLASMKLTGEQGIAEYLGEIREIKVDLEALGQPVTDAEMGFFALQGLPKEYATLVEILELGEMALSLDAIQPKLMQREQKLKLERELGETDETEPEVKAMAYAAKRKTFVSKGSSQEGGYHKSTDARTCFACGGLGHIRAHCRMRNAECHNCGEIGHVRAVCKKPGQGARRGGLAEMKSIAGVAFTVWPKNVRASMEKWVVDSGSTQHITPDRRRFVSYKKLAQPETIEGIGGEPLVAVGIGEVELECKTGDGVSKVTLKEVRHVPEAKANLVALKRATDAGARVVMERRVARFEMGGIVRMEAMQRDGLFEVETVEKPRAFLAVKPAIEKRVGEAARKPQAEEETGKVQKKTVKVIEVDLDSDDESDGPTKGSVNRDNGGTREHSATAEGVGAIAEGVGATTESVGAALGDVEAEKEVRGADEGGGQEMGARERGERYAERDTNTSREFWIAETGWVTPKAKKRAGKRT
eukprot:TRINITY_DN418_c0_g1_i2.p1 TRINITY_DN418_c0_g1~~TRINITY_DN418_c0_g1_i2.p1  ORF type:complete len:569 (+),score=90.43 TRINITY_DN418_c0_g1_i2:723-2429(+)